MRIYFDTEFTQFRDGQLLSAGFVADDDRFFYVEIDEPSRKKGASEFCELNVLPQFGLYPLARASAAARGRQCRLTFGHSGPSNWHR